MKHCLAIFLMCVAFLARAQSPVGAPARNYDRSLYEAMTLDKASVFEQIGGREALLRIVDDAVENLVADARIRRHFEKTDLERLKLLLFEQICQVSGGPCKYKGRDLAEAHKGLNITEADFIALVEDFQAALRKNGVSFEVENKLLALLSPMKRVSVYQ